MASVARAFAFALLGALVGAVAGGLAGLGLGLAWVTIAGTSGFEGYSGFVVGYWILGGIVAGMIGGAILFARLARRRGRAPTA